MELIFALILLEKRSEVMVLKNELKKDYPNYSDMIDSIVVKQPGDFLVCR